MNGFTKKWTTQTIRTFKGKGAPSFEEIGKNLDKMSEDLEKMGEDLEKSFKSSEAEVEVTVMNNDVEVKGVVKSLTVNGQKVTLPAEKK